MNNGGQRAFVSIAIAFNLILIGFSGVEAVAQNSGDIGGYRLTYQQRLEAFQRFKDTEKVRDDLSQLVEDYELQSWQVRTGKGVRFIFDAADGALGGAIGSTVGAGFKLWADHKIAAHQDARGYIAAQYTWARLSNNPATLKAILSDEDGPDGAWASSFIEEISGELDQAGAEPTKMELQGGLSLALAWHASQKNVQLEGDLNTLKNKYHQLGNDIKDAKDEIRRVEGRVNDLVEDDKQIRRDLEKLREKDAEFVRLFLFSQKSPEEQLKDIEAGKVQVPKSVKDKVKHQAERTRLIKERRKFQQAVSETVVLLQGFQAIGGELGLSEDVMAGLGIAIDVGSTVSSIAQRFTSDPSNWSYVGAAGLAMGLAGRLSNRGRPSAEEQRFRAIMARLGVIDRKLDKVLENQQTMIEMLGLLLKGQQQLGEQIDQFYRRTERNFERTFTTLEDIRARV